MPMQNSQGDTFYDIPFMVSIVSTAKRTLEQAMTEIEQQHEKCGLKYFAVSLPIQPQGADPMAKIADQVKQFRALLACRKNPEIKIGILFQQTLGHNATYNPHFDRELNWQRTVRNTGEVTVRFCPTGKEFQNYISQAVGLLAQGKPDFLVVDDDARLDVRSDLGYFECFCPNHTALFNQKYGTNYTPEEFRNAVNSAPDHDILLRKFTDLAAETLTDYMKLLRQSVDRTAPGIPMVLCGHPAHSGRRGNWAKILSGGNHPGVLRIGNGYYLENAPRGLALRFSTTAAQRVLEPSDVLLLDEADTCPHNCYSKSARTMHLHITAGLLNGLDGAKLWITDTGRFDPRITAPYADILAKFRGFYKVLHQTVRQVAWQGPLANIPRPEALPRPNMPRWLKIGMWITSYLAVYGLPFRYGRTDESGLHLLSDNDPDNFSDAELDKMLSESAFVDSAAAEKLIARGFAEKLGVREIRELNGSIQGEEIVENRIFLHRPMVGSSVLVPLPGTQVLTRFLLQGADPVPGAVRCRNVIVTAWRVKWDFRLDLQPDRKELLTYLLRQLPGGVPARFESNSDATLWFGRGKGFDLAAAVNYGFDPLEELLFELPGKPEKIQQLQPDGNWKETVFSEKDGMYRLPVKLDCAEIAVFRIFGSTHIG